MFKNKYLFFVSSIILSIILFIFTSVGNVFANPAITSFLLNGSSQSVTFNPNNSESVSIEVKANTQVKFTRLYICSVNQVCNGTSGNYTRYFTQSDISDTITKTWNGKKSGDVEMVPAGEYKVMVSMTEGTNDPITEFGPHSIFVDFSSLNSTTTNSTSSGNTNQNASTSTNSSSNTSNVSVITKTVYISTHSGTEDLSNYDEKTQFEISAGRERMALVGSIIGFDAKYTLLQKDYCTPTFKWSFGDGFETLGKNITHIYKYPGEYQVVLNGTCGEYSSISRTVTKIVVPEISLLGSANNDTEIINNGKTEVNIGNWKIKGLQKDFIFPQDTIISAGRKIILSKNDLNTGTSTEKISLNNQSDREVAYYYIKNTNQQNLAVLSKVGSEQSTTISDGSNISIAEAEILAKTYKEKLALNNNKINKAETTEENQTIEGANKNLQDSVNINQTASVVESINSSSTRGFWAKLIDIPVSSIKSFVRVFYDF